MPRPRRLLLRHPRSRRTRLRRPVGRARLQGAAWPARQPQVRDAAGRPERAPGADRERPRAPRRPEQDQPRRRRPGGALRRAHRGARPLHLLRRPPLPAAGPHHERVLRQPPQADLPGQGHRQDDGERHPDAQHVRQQVLRQPAQPGRALHLRPGPLRQRRHQAYRHQVRAEPVRLLRPVRRLHGQDGADQGAHRFAGPDPQELLRAQPRHRQRRRPPVVRRGDRRRGCGEPRVLDSLALMVVWERLARASLYVEIK